jgi:hypothetical protein
MCIANLWLRRTTCYTIAFIFRKQSYIPMNEKLKAAGAMTVGLLFMAAMFVLAALFIEGAGWVSDKLLPWLSFASILAFLVLVIILLPLSFIRAARPFASTSLLYISYIFGVTAWMEGLLITLALWGTGAVILGLCFAGVGVVPLGMLAALFHAQWRGLFELIVLTALTFGVRIWGAWLTVTIDEAAELQARSLYLGNV